MEMSLVKVNRECISHLPEFSADVLRCSNCCLLRTKFSRCFSFFNISVLVSTFCLCYSVKPFTFQLGFGLVGLLWVVENMVPGNLANLILFCTMVCDDLVP